ncbi:hypothetical protein GF386_02850 [Candidatus Pacearchaeota archaeon]|nr:hypothetical protein [Candidatus Pacearchaeota archaeon]MBD3283087.1 hypothetical protein [Candidatus Pacearchaeota archaeon]
MKKRKKRGALELSMGTVVILVLAMSMLILGLILVRTIFSSAGGAVDNIDKGVKDAISKMFADSDKKLVVYPSARRIEIEQRTQGLGFAFSTRNLDTEPHDYEYRVEVDPGFDIKRKCGGLSKKEADSWLLIDSGTLSLAPGSIMEEPELIAFSIPEFAPPCTIPYKVDVWYKPGSPSTTLYISAKILLTVEPR